VSAQERNSRSLHYATPDFLSRLVGMTILLCPQKL
jgi:hypothetical protein